MDVDVPITTNPTPISSVTTPNPPAPAVYTPVVNDPVPAESSTRGLASSIHGPGNQMVVDPTQHVTEPNVVEQVSEKFESRFKTIENSLTLILATIQKLGQTPAPPIAGKFRADDWLPSNIRSTSEDSLYTNRSHKSAAPIKWPGAPDHPEPIYKETDPVTRPVTQEELDATAKATAEMNLPEEDVLPEALKKNRRTRMKDAVRRINSQVPGACVASTSKPAVTSRPQISAEPQICDEIRGHIPVNKPLKPLFSTITAKTVG